jgi:hypothetical protein
MGDRLVPAYAVYALAPVGVDGALEAGDIEYWACGPEHAQTLAGRVYGPTAIGQNTDALPGTGCELCGLELVAA